MSELLRVAIVGTGQVAEPASDLTLSPADALIDGLGSCERERAFLLRAAAFATLRRAGRPPLVRHADPAHTSAGEEMLPAFPPKLTAIVRELLGGSDQALLAEALQRAAAARLRLPDELLPLALAQTGSERRTLLKPLLGARGPWLAGQRPSFRWALGADTTAATLPDDFDTRWAEGTGVERAALLELCFACASEHARGLLEDGWKHEKAEQRATWLALLEPHLRPSDEAFLVGLEGDRSATVRSAARRLLWRLPDSQVRTRVRERARALVSYAASSGMTQKLKALAGGARGAWKVELPSQVFDPAWERDGLVEASPRRGIGARQWWLMQMVSAVPPDDWLVPGASIGDLIRAAREHDYAAVLLDGLTSAALREGSTAWFAPLWDLWLERQHEKHDELMLLVPPLAELLARLPSSEREARALALLADARHCKLLAQLPAPWPERLAHAFVATLPRVRGEWTELVACAAYAIPVAQLPAPFALPEVPDNDSNQRAYVGALAHFQAVAALRRSIAEETVQ